MRLSRRATRLLTVTLLGVVAVGVVVLRRLEPVEAPGGSGLVLRALDPAIRLLGWMDRRATGLFASGLSLFTARRAAERLETENAELRREIAQLRQALRRVGRWPELVATAEALTLPTVAVELLARGPHPDHPTIWVDAGTEEGVEEGCPVTSPRGLVGRVVETDDNMAVVRLITAERLGVAALIAETGAPGMVCGMGAPDRLEFIPQEQGIEVQIGQSVITAGFEDSFFPPGIPIGEVSQIGATDRGMRRAHVRPAVNMARLDHLLVVIGPPQRLRPIEGRQLVASPASLPDDFGPGSKPRKRPFREWATAPRSPQPGAESP